MVKLCRALLLSIMALSFCAKADGGVLENLLKKKGTQAQQPMIRVLILSDQPGAVVEVKGKYHLFNPNDGLHISTRFLGKRKYVQALKGGLQWGEEFPGIYQLKIVPDDASGTTIVDGVEYFGSIYIYDVEGTIHIINELPVENFLASTTGPKVRENLPAELLAALAITARTNAYFYIANPKTQYWDVDGRKINYQGYAVVDGQSPIEKAIYDTRYLIMSQSEGRQNEAIPFLASFGPIQPIQNGLASKISIDEAAKMADKGAHAAQILSKSFPGSSLMLMYSHEK